MIYTPMKLYKCTRVIHIIFMTGNSESPTLYIFYNPFDIRQMAYSLIPFNNSIFFFLFKESHQPPSFFLKTEIHLHSSII